jgi:glycosyltransferase involved in cell wall biosynthesis
VRVALATTAPDVGGVTRHVFDLAGGLQRLGHVVTITSRGDAGPVVLAARERGLEWVPLPRSVRLDADVWHLHLHNSLDGRALPLLAARRALARGAVVLTEHLPRTPRTEFTWPANIPRTGAKKPGAAMVKRMLKRSQFGVADAVVAVSSSSADFIARRWGVDRRRITTIHNGVAVPSGQPPLRAEGAEMRVVAIAALHRLKGIDVLLDAAALAREPWTVRIVGDGPMRAELEARAARLPHERRVEFTGWRADASTAALEGDVVCAPSRAESFSYVVLEALACARPVVAAAVDGAGEAVRDGENGLLVAPDDPEQLAGALDALARDPARRARMGRAAYARSVAEFELETMVRATAALYESARSSRA